MREQRWSGDYETVEQEFRYSREEERMGMSEAEQAYRNDILTLGLTRRLDHAQMNEMEPSFCTQLDINGMQPHAREYLETDVTSYRSQRKFSMIEGQMIDHCDGIHFDGRP